MNRKSDPGVDIAAALITGLIFGMFLLPIKGLAGIASEDESEQAVGWVKLIAGIALWIFCFVAMFLD